ncbi:MAG TPA: D-2-hydroxyacid dehydrogenase family protein [Acidothermaceae bacterium]
MTHRVLVLDDYQDVARKFGPWQQLSGVAGSPFDLDVRTEHLDGEALTAALQGVDIVVAMRERTPFTRDVLAQAPALKLLVTTGMANASIDLDACRELGVEVRGTTGLRASTAELTWGLILTLARQICAEDRQVRGGGWQHTLGFELAGARLGVVGLGKLGSEVAKIGLAFSMDVVAWSQNLQPEYASELGVRAVAKHELFATSDVVTLHLKLSDRTRGVVGADELAAMSRTAYLVNTSRGPLIDQDALIDALRTDSIAGAGLDVFDIEPLPADHPLRTLPNTVLTPHVGYVTTATYERWWPQVVEDIRSWADGEAVRVL